MQWSYNPAIKVAGTSFLPTVILSLSLFFTGVSYSSLLPFNPIAAISGLGFSQEHFALMVTVSAVLSAIVAVSIGLLSDKISDRRFLILPIAVLGVFSNLLIFFVQSKFSFILSFCILGPVVAALFSQLFSFVRVFYDQSGGADPSFMISMMRTVFAVAWVVNPPIVGYFVAEYSVFAAFCFAAVGYFLTAVIFSGTFLLGQARIQPAGKNNPSAQAEGPKISIPIILGLFGIVFIRLAMNLQTITLPLAITTDLSASMRYVGVVSGLAAGLEIPFMILWAYLGRRFSNAQIIIFNALIFALYLYFLQGAEGLAMVLILQPLNALAVAALLSITISYVQNAVKGYVGLSTSLGDVVWVAAQISSAAVFAAYATPSSYFPVFYIASVFALFGAAILCLAHFHASKFVKSTYGG